MSNAINQANVNVLLPNNKLFSNQQNKNLQNEEIKRKTLLSIYNRLMETINENKQNSNYKKIIKKQSKQIFTSKKMPSISLNDYLNRLFNYTKCDLATVIISLIYIDRFLKKSTILLNEKNVHRILVSSLLVSIKMNEDQKGKKAFYAIIAGMDKYELNILEREFIYEINFDLFVYPEIYNYYIRILEI